MAEQKKIKSGFVAVVGRPNAGKSTLINQLMGEKVLITSDKPQTTRNRIACIWNDPEAQVVFLDTPGIHKPHHELGKRMVDAALATLQEVDLVYYIVDGAEAFGSGEQFIIDRLASIKTPVFLILNKIDRLTPEKVLTALAEWQKRLPSAEFFPLSALHNRNVDTLMAKTKEYLSEGPRYYPEDMVVDQPERFLAAELIREKIIKATEEEIPYSVAVEVEGMKEQDNGTLHVQATIYVERESQKGIVIGNQGARLKDIGRLARLDMEKLFGQKVFLELWVKVKKDWRNRKGILSNLGYEYPVGTSVCCSFC